MHDNMYMRLEVTSFSFRPNRGLGPSCSSQHSGAKGTSPPATPPNISRPASTATMTGPARVPGSFPLLFCMQKNTHHLHVLCQYNIYQYLHTSSKNASKVVSSLCVFLFLYLHVASQPQKSQQKSMDISPLNTAVMAKEEQACV